jgi:hypothetical protein
MQNNKMILLKVCCKIKFFSMIKTMRIRLERIPNSSLKTCEPTFLLISCGIYKGDRYRQTNADIHNFTSPL